VIRSLTDAKDMWSKALETASVLAVFGIPLWLSQFPIVTGAWRFVVPLIAFLIAVALPTFVYGRPNYSLTWRVLNESAKGTAVVDMHRAPAPFGIPEVTFCVDLAVSTQSLWAWHSRRKLLRLGAEVRIEILPPQSTVLKMQNRTGNACLQSETQLVAGAELDHVYIVLPVVNAAEEASQSRFVGSIVPTAIVSKSEELSVSATLRFKDKKGQWRERALSADAAGIKTIRIRS